MPNKRRPPAKKPASAPAVAYSSEEDEAGGFTLTGAEAMLNSGVEPTMSTEGALPRELPCSLTGINSGLGGGALGYVFGFGESKLFAGPFRLVSQQGRCEFSGFTPAGSQLIKHRGKGRWKACTKEGWTSAKAGPLLPALQY